MNDFTPNPARAIRVQGKLNEALMNLLRPQILELTSQNRSPITVFIDSPGGDTAVTEEILSLLRSTDHEGESTCRIITVAAGRMASAATHLLSGGDFAIASPESSLLYHGVRYQMEEVTAERAELMATGTKLYNERRAASFARMCTRRSMFIISALRSSFEKHRRDVHDRNLPDVECFKEILIPKLSPVGQRVLSRAVAMQVRSERLINNFLKEIAAGRPSGRAETEKLMLNASVAFEYQHMDVDRNRFLSLGGLSRINEDFFFLREFVGDEHGSEAGDFCDGNSATDGDDSPENMRAFFLPFWPFLIAIYRALGEGENELTATDALWLGLIDTVRADS